MEDNLNRGFGPSDLVFYQEGVNIMSGGFLINNIFLEGNQPVLKTINSIRFSSFRLRNAIVER